MILRIITYFVLLISLTGCLSTKYIETKQYLFDIKINKKQTIPINQITAVAPFDQTNFLYRISTDQYLIDYYNVFMVSPIQQIEPIITPEISKIECPLKLQVRLTELYADYRNRNAPKAVVSLRFTVTKNITNKNNINNKEEVVFNKNYKSEINLKEKDTESLMAGWNAGLKNIINEGIASLNKCKESCS